MYTEFNRRTFLKAGAALVGAAALMGLTGCSNNSSSDSHPINKIVSDGQVFDVGGAKVKYGSYTTGTDGSGNPYCEVKFSFTTPAEGTVLTICNSNFSATYDGAILNFAGLKDEALNPITGKYTIERATSAKPGGVLEDGQVDIYAKFNGFPAALDAIDPAKLAFKFSYNDKSIKFSKNNTNTLTSGVYADKF